MKRKKWLWIVLALALFGCVGVGLMSQTGGSEDKNGATEQVAAATSGAEKQAPVAKDPAATKVPKPTNTPKPEPTATPVPGIGQEVDTGAVLWVVLKAEDLGQTLKSDNQFIDSKKTEGRFISVSYKAENQGDDKRYFEAPELIDAKGRKFNDYDESLFFISDDEQCVFEELNPNVAKTCTVIYEVAADATGLRARVTGALLDKPIEVDLGLK